MRPSAEITMAALEDESEGVGTWLQGMQNPGQQPDRNADPRSICGF